MELTARARPAAPAHSESQAGACGAPQLESLWDRHGASAYTLACALLGDEEAAARAVRLAITDLVSTTGRESPEDALRPLTRRVYRRSQEIAVEPSGRSDLPPVMVWLAQLARLQRACLAVCFYGGLTHREAADLLGVPPGTVADLLTAGLRELGRLAAHDPVSSA